MARDALAWPTPSEWVRVAITAAAIGTAWGSLYTRQEDMLDRLDRIERRIDAAHAADSRGDVLHFEG